MSSGQFKQWLLVGLAALVAVPAIASDRTTTPVLALQTLSPGPLPPVRQLAGRKELRPKTATIGEAIDQCVEWNMLQLDAPGAAVSVMLYGEMLYESGYGEKTRGGGDAVDPQTIFRIGSVTKQMTAAAVMQQVELGRVDLGAPVTDYIPELEIGGRWPAERITVWNALTHTTGFPDLVNDTSSIGEHALSRWALRQGEVELHAPPGSFWNYSNPNFMIAGLVAERASGTPYRVLFKEELWEPAGMHSTTFEPYDVVVASGNYSSGHYYDPIQDRERILNPYHNNLWAAGPAGFAFSTVQDLTRWALLLMDGGGPVLSPQLAAAMQTPQQWTHYTPDLFYGYGIMVESHEVLDVRQHGGSVAGYGTYLLWVPERRFAVALLTNVSSPLSAAAYCIVDEVLDPAPLAPPDLSTDPSTWDRYEGEYQVTDMVGERTAMTVALLGDHLFGSVEDPDAPGSTRTTLLTQRFLDTFSFDRDGDGTPETDFTFCSRSGEPGFMMWMRSRYAVGERQLTPRSGGRLILP